MAKFRKKPVVIDAINYEGGKQSAGRAFDFMAEPCAVWLDNDNIAIPTREGTMEAAPGDWIIRGIKGELYPCKPDIFAATYDPVTPSQSASHGGLDNDAPATSQRESTADIPVRSGQ